MIRKRILSLLVCAALLCGVLAGCSTSSGSTAASSSSASASESIPSSTVTADTGKVGPLDAGENSLFSLSDPDDAFAPCLGWGPGVSGCSLSPVSDEHAHNATAQTDSMIRLSGELMVYFFIFCSLIVFAV